MCARPQGRALSFEHFDTVTVSIADARGPEEIVVVMAIADGAVSTTAADRPDPLREFTETARQLRTRRFTGNPTSREIGRL